MSGEISLVVLFGSEQRYYNPATTRYVRKDGNDTTGDGSTLAPWLTVNKAYADAGTIAGFTIRVGDGVYQEDSGSGYFALTKNLASWLTIEAEKGSAGDVTIQGASSAVLNVSATADVAYHRFNNIKFIPRLSGGYSIRLNTNSNYFSFNNCTLSGTTVSALFINSNGSGAKCQNISFSGCTLTSGLYGVQFATAAGGLISGSFSGCTITGGTGAAHYGVRIVATSPALVDGVSFVGCAISGGIGTEVNGGQNISFVGGSITSTGDGQALTVGVDGETGNATTATFTGITINKSTNTDRHVAIIGAGATACVMDGCTILAGNNYGLVIKENTGTEVKNCTIYAGTTGASRRTALFCKAAISANIHNNTLISTIDYCFELLKGTTNNKNQNVTFVNNALIGSGTAAMLNWGAAVDDAGGGVCDYNIYTAGGTSKFGNVWGTAAIQTLADLRTAWATYGDGSNDSHSTAA